nr:unnamed protein product [Callosobruchus analis]
MLASSSDSNVSDSSSEDDISEDELLPEGDQSESDIEIQMPVKKFNRTVPRKGWSDEETKELIEHFKIYINKNKYPSTAEIKKYLVMKKQRRTVSQIIIKIQHIIKCNNKNK